MRYPLLMWASATLLLTACASSPEPPERPTIPDLPPTPAAQPDAMRDCPSAPEVPDELMRLAAVESPTPEQAKRQAELALSYMADGLLAYAECRKRNAASVEDSRMVRDVWPRKHDLEPEQ